jgi:hypothetical protein
VEYDEVKRRIGIDIPEDEYKYFFLPNENKRRLHFFRATGEIIE